MRCFFSNLDVASDICGGQQQARWMNDHGGLPYGDGIMRGNRVNDSFQAVQLTVCILEGLAIVDAGTFEQLVGLESKDAGGGQAAGVAGFEVDEGRVSQTEARMIELAPLGARLHVAVD